MWKPNAKFFVAYYHRLIRQGQFLASTRILGRVPDVKGCSPTLEHSLMETGDVLVRRMYWQFG